MIIKELIVPQKLLSLEATLRRLPVNYQKLPYIEKDYHRVKAGYNGEKALDFYLNQLPTSNYLIFHDLRLNVNRTYFQIDTLLLSNKFILILEIKNITGKLVFDPIFKQMIRIYQEKETGLLDPLTQAKRQQHHLTAWLKQMNLPALPIEYLVVISHPKSIIEIKSGFNKEYKRLCHAAQLIEKISEFEADHSEVALLPKEVNKTKRALLKNHQPLLFNPLRTYDISESDLLLGVFCPYCSFLSMNRLKGTWYCPSCQKTNKDAHISAISDFFHIIKPSITNEEFRQFIKLSSRQTSTRLLHSLNLPYKGDNKGRVYYPSQ